MENDGKKSGEDYQRQLLLCAVGGGFDPANLVRRGIRDDVSLAARKAIGGELSLVTPEFDVRSLDSSDVGQFERYYDYIFKKYFRFENFPGDMEKRGTISIKSLIRFRENLVSWIKADLSGFDLSDVKVIFPENEEKHDNTKPYISVVPKECFSFTRKEMTVSALFANDDWPGGAHVCFVKAMPVSEKWGAILLTAILAGLAYRCEAGAIGLSGVQRRLESLKKTVAQNVMAKYLSDGKFELAVNAVISKYNITDLRGLIFFAADSRLMTEVVSDLSKTFGSGQIGEDDKALCRNLFIHSVNLALARTGSSRGNNAIGEAIEGLSVLVEEGVIS